MMNISEHIDKSDERCQDDTARHNYGYHNNEDSPPPYSPPAFPSTSAPSYPVEPPPPYTAGSQNEGPDRQTQAHTVTRQPGSQHVRPLPTVPSNIGADPQIIRTELDSRLVVVNPDGCIMDLEKSLLLERNYKVTCLAIWCCFKGNYILGIPAMFLAYFARYDFEQDRLNEGRRKTRWSIGLSIGGWFLTMVVVIIVVCAVLSNQGSSNYNYHSYD